MDPALTFACADAAGRTEYLPNGACVLGSGCQSGGPPRCARLARMARSLHSLAPHLPRAPLPADSHRRQSSRGVDGVGFARAGAVHYGSWYNRRYVGDRLRCPPRPPARPAPPPAPPPPLLTRTPVPCLSCYSALAGFTGILHLDNECICCALTQDERQAEYAGARHEHGLYPLGCFCTKPVICKHCTYKIMLSDNRNCPACLKQLNTTRLLAGGFALRCVALRCTLDGGSCYMPYTSPPPRPLTTPSPLPLHTPPWPTGISDQVRCEVVNDQQVPPSLLQSEMYTHGRGRILLINADGEVDGDMTDSDDSQAAEEA